MRIVKVDRKSIVTATGALLAFAGIFAVGHYATRLSLPAALQGQYYLDAHLMRYYLSVVALMGAVPVALGLYRLGLIFVAGASAGWLVNCVMIAASDPLRPTMEPGIRNLFILVLGALAATVAEVVHQVRRHRTRQSGASGRSSA